MYRAGPHVRARRHRADPDRPGLPAGLRHRLRRQAPRWSSWSRWPGNARPAGALADRSRVGRGVPGAQAHHAPADPLRQRPGQAAAGLRGDEPGLRPGRAGTSAPSACRRSPARSSCTSTSRGTGSTPARPARWAGRCRPRSASCVADPDATVVALSGDYDFQFMIEELAVGAQFNLPYLHVRGEQLLPRADPAVAARLRHGLLRAAGLRQRQLPPRAEGYGVDHVKVAEAWAARRCGSPSPRRCCPRRSSRR